MAENNDDRRRRRQTQERDKRPDRPSSGPRKGRPKPPTTTVPSTTTVAPTTTVSPTTTVAPATTVSKTKEFYGTRLTELTRLINSHYTRLNQTDALSPENKEAADLLTASVRDYVATLSEFIQKYGVVGNNLAVSYDVPANISTAAKELSNPSVALRTATNIAPALINVNTSGMDVTFARQWVDKFPAAAQGPRAATPTGPTGPTAPTGPTGPTGPTAPTAPTGPTGPVTPGATGPRTGTGKTTKTPKLTWNQVSAKFKQMFPTQSWMVDIDPAKYPDVQALISKAQRNNYTPERFAEEWKNTSFYKELATTGKVREITQIIGDAGFDSTSFNSFLTKSMNLGWQGDTLRFETYKEAFRKDDNGQYVNATTVERVKKSNGYLQVSNIGKAYFNQVADDTVQRVLMGEMTQDDVARQQRELAKSRYGHLSNLIDQGLTLQDIADNYRTQAAQLLEKDPNSIDMSSADYEVALNFGEPDKKRLMTQGEWQRLLRSDAKYGWEKTNNAKQEAQKLSDSIVAAFGRVI